MIKNKRLLNAISAICFILILVLLLSGLSVLFSPTYDYENKNSNKNMTIEYRLEKKDTIDVLIMGNSNAEYAISPMELWNEYGYTSYNCGDLLLRTSDIYYKFKDVLKYQSPKIVFLETDAFFSVGSKADDMDKTIGSTFNNYFSVFKYHNKWKKIVDLGNEKKSKWLAFKGFGLNKGKKPFKGSRNFMIYSKEYSVINKTTMFYFQMIKNLCEKNGIKLILFCAPSPAAWNESKHDGIETMANKYNIPFIDMNDILEEINFSFDYDTYDAGFHMNLSGARKVSTYIGKYISENENLADHRQDFEYSSWNEEYQKYIDYINGKIKA